MVKVVQAMYVGTKSKTCVNSYFGEEFQVKVGVHQGSVLSPLLFIIVLEALSCKFRVGSPWEMLYTDELVILGVIFHPSNKKGEMLHYRLVFCLCCKN